ncbi:ABC transporter ATP-binding protein [Desulfotomaculum copahuensis]|uniref:Peptide ABC transporter ATP-binding protein n=1 Tax=Desulfotomaculum copahuensis TaxID=1838280 RepID=A0A1B7LEP2_9FIRM|nr:ABC transporter ATP-binding protein [Desulfotomaculum copahuensis]OAT81759.1 peptide ABC transporter ATP-binding protein [Desulfotomaculum copahuensis]
MTETLLQVRGLKVNFNTSAGTLYAVNGVDLNLRRGQTLGVVGESGSGKSVTALAVMGLLPKNTARVAGGEILFHGRDLLRAGEEEMRRLRGNEISMIFQDPMTSLNPVYTIGDQVAEAVLRHRRVDKKQALTRAVEMLKLVGIPEAEQRLRDYPHQFSGGMRQRVMIAMALACNPQLLIADEPTTALDVTIQAQILDLMRQLRDELHTSIIMITHDLGVVAELCDQVLVMYAGRPVEYAGVQAVFASPAHPYTRGLLASLPRLDDDSGRRLEQIEGAPPSLLADPAGCAFAPRCRDAREECRQARPSRREVAPGHLVACHRAGAEEGGFAGGRNAAQSQ